MAAKDGNRKKAVLLDLDGVVYSQGKPCAGARETTAWLEQADIPHLFLTNTTSRPRGGVAHHLAEMGIDVPTERILTPPVAATAWLAEHVDRPVALFVPEATREDFASLAWLDEDAEEGAGAVVLGDLGTDWTFERLNRAFRLLMQEPRPVLVALGMTRYWKGPQGLQLDVAPFVVALEHASGSRRVVLGKPASEFFAQALALVGARAEDTVMVGDDIVGDVGGARSAGITALLVRTGKFRPADLERDDVVPDAVLDSIGALRDWWHRG